MSQAVSNNVALFFSIFDKHRKTKASLASVFIQLGIEKNFCFYFLVINVYRGKTITDAFHPCGELRNG